MAARRDSGLSNRAIAATVSIAFLVLFAIGTRSMFGYANRTTPQPEIIVKSIGPTITQLQSLGELVVLRVSVADVLEAMGQGYKGAWLVKGDALLSVDLRVAEFTLTDQENKRLVIALPKPTVIQPRVDHDKTRTWEVSKTTWVPWSGDPDKLRDQTMSQAQKLVAFACSKDDIAQQAKYNTRLLLTHMYRFIEWDVEIQWADDAASVDPDEPTPEERISNR